MIIPYCENWARPEDYDGYNDYYVNPEYQPRSPMEKFYLSRQRDEEEKETINGNCI